MKKKSLSFWTLSALSVGNMIGAGIFLIPSTLAGIGSISLYSWVITTIGTLILALIFIELNRKDPSSGGPFVYARHAFGDFIGFAVAYAYWVAWCVANTGMVVVLAGYLSEYIPMIHDKSPQYLPWMSFLVKAGVVWLVTFINILGIKESGRVQLITTVIKILPLIIIPLFGLFYMQGHELSEGFNLTQKSDANALMLGLAITLWAYIGFESALIPSEEASSSSSIKKAILFGVFLAAFLYIFGSVVLMKMIPLDVLQHSNAPYAEAGVRIFGPIGGTLVSIGAIISIIGALNGSILVQVHVAQAAAKKRLFLPVFSAVNRIGTPVKGFVFSAIIMTAMLLLTINDSLMKQFNFVVLLSTFAFLVPYFVSAAAYLIFLVREKKVLKQKFSFLRYSLALLGILYAFFTMVGAGQEIVFYGILFFFSTFPLYAFFKRKSRTLD